MPKRASNMADAIVSGIRKAHEAYDKISGVSRWVWDGAEYFVTTYVATSLKGMGWNYYVTLESIIENVMSMLDESRGVPIKSY